MSELAIGAGFDKIHRSHNGEQMMNVRAMATLGAGLVLAVAAVLMVNQRLSHRGEAVKVESAFEVVPVVVAAHDIAFGASLSGELLRVASWPADSVPQGSFSTAEAILGDRSEERVALKPIAQGEPVLASKVSGFGGRASMSTVLPEGKRAYSIRVNDVSGVAGFLLPGDRVDILLTRQPDQDRDQQDQVTDVILQNIVVRGIDQISDEDRNKPQVVRAVTVEVTPEEAQKLALAMQVGSLTLALRNVASVEQVPVRTVRVADLVRGEQKAKAPAPAPARAQSAPPSVIVRRGAEVSVVNVAGY